MSNHTSDSSSDSPKSYYAYNPSHALPLVSAALIGVSLLLHIFQNFRYRFWRITWLSFWAGLIFTLGWIMRYVSIRSPSNLNLFITQSILIYLAPPVYAAIEYNILSRLMRYLPMHAILNPSRVFYFFTFLASVVEAMTAIGASYMSSARDDASQFKRGMVLIAIASILQGLVECLFMVCIGLIHHRCARSKMLARNVRTLFIMLYGTSALILIRCVFRTVESFLVLTQMTCSPRCNSLITHEWYLYVFETLPCFLYTYWLNGVHPGRFLPRQRTRYLDQDARTERMGPGWVNERSAWMILADPFDFIGLVMPKSEQERFWLTPEKWPVAEDGSFAEGTASNVRGKSKLDIERRYQGTEEAGKV
ncbi:MAG: hypothetical protein Q9160_008248 [Pyrenula sp. 1 TL-2023]